MNRQETDRRQPMKPLLDRLFAALRPAAFARARRRPPGLHFQPELPFASPTPRRGRRR